MGRIVNCGAVTLIALACVAGCEKSGTESSDAGPRAEVQAVADKPVDALLADLTGPELDKRVVACEAGEEVRLRTQAGRQEAQAGPQERAESKHPAHDPGGHPQGRRLTFAPTAVPVIHRARLAGGRVLGGNEGRWRVS